MAGKKITQLVSGSLSDLPLSGVTPVVYSGITKQHTLSDLRNKLVDSGSHHFTGSQYIKGNLEISGSITAHEYILSSSITNIEIQNVSGSSYFGNDSTDTHQFRGHVFVTGSLGTSEFIMSRGFGYFKDYIIVGPTAAHSTGSEFEAAHISTTSSINIAHFEGNNEYYSQVNITNVNSGSLASSDLVLTADNGNETVHFIDLGINSSTYNGGYVGYENDAYLLNVGKDLYVGTVGGTNHPAKLHLFANNSWENPQITVHTGSQITFNTSSFTSGYTYEFSGSVKLQNDILVDGELSIGSVNEKIVLNEGGGLSTYELNYNNGSIFYLTGSLGTNDYNIINIPIDGQKAISLTFVIKQGSTPYIASGYQFDGANLNINWANGEIPTGNANKTDVIGLTAFRIGSSWDVLGVHTTFGQ